MSCEVRVLALSCCYVGAPENGGGVGTWSRVELALQIHWRPVRPQKRSITPPVIAQSFVVLPREQAALPS